VLATFQGDLLPILALGALHPQYDLLGGLGLLPENRFGLTSITLLFTIVTPSALGGSPFLGLLVLGDLMQLVMLTLLTEGLPLLRDVDHFEAYLTNSGNN